MSAARRGAHRGATVVVGLVLLSLALTLLIIGANSPYTHANLSAAYDDGYTRTDQIIVGPAVPFGGFTERTARGGDAAARGGELYVTAGCAGCHGLRGQGGAVGLPIATAVPEKFTAKVRSGGLGMPAFDVGGLSDAELADIVTYLRSLVAAK